MRCPHCNKEHDFWFEAYWDWRERWHAGRIDLREYFEGLWLEYERALSDSFLLCGYCYEAVS